MPVGTVTPTTSSPHSRRPLIVTNDSALLDDLLRLAAAGCVEAHVEVDPAAARPHWMSAPLAIVGSDLAGACAHAQLPARPGLIIAGPSGGKPPWSEAEALRAEHIAVLPMAETWLVDQFADYSPASTANGRVVAILGGRGGCGASVLASALAVMARRRGLDALLVDADPGGGGVDLVLGWERLRGMRWPDLVDARGRVNPPALMKALPGVGSLAVLSFDRSTLESVPAPAMEAAIDAGRRGRDVVVVDVPRRLDDAGRVALAAADQSYIVVPAEIRACVAARQVAATAAEYCSNLSVVVRDPVPGGVTADHVAQAVGLPIAGLLRTDAGIMRLTEAGAAPASNGRGPLARLCRDLLADVRPRRHRVGVR